MFVAILAGTVVANASVLTSLGVLLLAAGVFVEARVPEPVIPLSIFHNRTVSLATVASLLVGVAMFGGTVFLSQYVLSAPGGA